MHHIEWFDGNRRLHHFTCEYKRLDAIVDAVDADGGKSPGRNRTSPREFFKTADFAKFLKARESVPFQRGDELEACDGERLILRRYVPRNDNADTWWYYPPNNRPGRATIESYFDRIGWGRRDPSSGDSEETRNPDEWPAGLASPGCVLLTEAEVVDGVDCAIVECPGKVKLWLDPRRGHALVRRHVWLGDDKAFEFEFTDFEEVIPGAWMPRRIDMYTIGSREYPPEFAGQRVLRNSYSITLGKANAADGSGFQIPNPAPGDYVQDMTLPLLDENGKPIELEPSPLNPPVSYRQPPQGVDALPIIEQAQKAAGKEVLKRRSKGKRK